MQKVLRKRVLRNLRRHMGRYFALCLLVILGVFIVVSLLGAAQNIIDGTAEFAQKNRIEDGEWETFIPLRQEQLQELDGKGIEVEEQFYIDFSQGKEPAGDAAAGDDPSKGDGSAAGDSSVAGDDAGQSVKPPATIRLFRDRKSVNLVELDDGRKAEADDEIVLEKRFMEVHGLQIGDSLEIGGREFTITGIGTTADYESPFKKMADSTVDSAQFGTGFVTPQAYQSMKDAGTALESEKYIYAYRITDGSLTDDDVRETVESFPFDWKKAEDPYFKAYVKQRIGDAQVILDFLGSPLMEGDKDAQKLREQMEPDIHNLQMFVPRGDNMRIGGASADVRINKYVSLVAGVIILALFSYVIAVFTIHEIDAESSVIGALYSLGVNSGDLLRHYMLLPAAVTALGGVIGTILAYSPIGVAYQMMDTYLYYSVPAISLKAYAYTLIYGLLLPPVIAIIVNSLVIRKKLSCTALFLLRGGRKEASGKRLRLGKMGFISRFRIRRLLREMRAAITMAAGLYVSLTLVFMAVDCYVMCRHVEVDNLADTHYEYMYMYKYPDSEVPEGGIPAFAKTLNKERFGYNLEVTLLGTDTENPYFDAEVPEGRKEVAISSAMAQKYGIKEGETMVLEDRESEQYYAFRVNSIVQYSPSFMVFMDIDEMREMFGEDDDYYNVVFSDHELSVDSGKLLSVITRAQIEQAGHVFVNLMASMVYTMTAASAFIFFVVLYLMMGVMVDRASYDISLMKIFGYRRGEIRKLYLNGNTYFVALGSLIAIPLAKRTIDAMYPYFISNVACGMDLSMSPLVYVGLFVIIMVMYFVINALLVRRIDRVTPAEVLKNRE